MASTPAPAATYVAASLAGLLTSFLDQRGLALPALRDKLARLAQGPRMPIATWWGLLEALQQALPGEPALGLQVGACVKPHHVGVLGYLALYSETLGQALLRFTRFQPLLHNLVPSFIGQQGDALVIRWGAEDQPSTTLSDDVLVAGLMVSVRQLTGRQDLRALRIDSPRPAPADTTPYARFHGCPVHFGSAVAAVHLPLETVHLPINSQDAHLTGLLEQQAEALLQALPSPDPWLSALQRQIAAALQDGQPDAAVVAARMGLSERSLYRTLQQRGLRYKQVLNQLRNELAKDYLRDPQLSLPEIALMLAYAEQSVFSRAFRQWEGESPLRWRRRVGGSYNQRVIGE